MARASSAPAFALPAPMHPPLSERTNTSSPAQMASSIKARPGRSTLIPWSRMNGAALSSTTTNRFCGWKRAYASGRGMGSHRRSSGIYRREPAIPPPITISSIRSVSGTLFKRTSWPSGTSGAPKCSSKVLLMSAISAGNAGRASPGGVSGTSRVAAPQAAQVFARTGVWHWSHQRRRILPR